MIPEPGITRNRKVTSIHQPLPNTRIAPMIAGARMFEQTIKEAERALAQGERAAGAALLARAFQLDPRPESLPALTVIARLLAGHDQQAQIWLLKPGREAS